MLNIACNEAITTVSNIYLDKIWKENPEYIRRFYDNLETNIKLSQETEYIIKNRIKSDDIEIAQTSSRAKSLDSFCEKLSRKKYKKPFDEITDFSGVRVVYLYASDRAKIEKIIEEEFDVIEKVDKAHGDENTFGYGALHYLVKIPDAHAGARYNELKNKVCEIQVRTILQDAWAVVAHHLSYKQESDVPKILQRKLNALSGLFETADDQFENIKIARGKYQSDTQDSIGRGEEYEFIEEANVDNLSAYLASKFPDRTHRGIEGVADLLHELKNYGFTTLSSIDSMINSSIDAVYAEEEAYPPSLDGEDETDVKTRYSTIGLARTALVFMSEEYLNNEWDDSRSKQIEEFRHLVKT